MRCMDVVPLWMHGCDYSRDKAQAIAPSSHLCELKIPRVDDAIGSFDEIVYPPPPTVQFWTAWSMGLPQHPRLRLWYTEHTGKMPVAPWVPQVREAPQWTTQYCGSSGVAVESRSLMLDCKALLELWFWAPLVQLSHILLPPPHNASSSPSSASKSLPHFSSTWVSRQAPCSVILSPWYSVHRPCQW